KDLQITQYKVLINTLGDRESQDAYQVRLRDHFKDSIDTMCPDCQRRYVQNPLRILDCKVDQQHEALISAPSNVDSLSQESLNYFENLKNLLDESGIQYEVDSRL